MRRHRTPSKRLLLMFALLLQVGAATSCANERETDREVADAAPSAANVQTASAVAATRNWGRSAPGTCLHRSPKKLKAGKAAPGQVAQLVRQLSASTCRARQSAAYELGNLGPDAAPAVPALIVAINAAHPPLMSNEFESIGCNVRDNALRAVAQIGVPAAPAVRELVKALGPNASSLELEVLEGFVRIGPDARDALPDLLNMIRRLPRPDCDDRGCSADERWYMTIKAIGAIGAGASKAIPYLEELAKHEDCATADEADAALRAIRSRR